MLAPFKNEPVLELRRAPVREQLAEALTALERGLTYEAALQAALEFG